MMRKNPYKYWWARQGSNLEPAPYDGISRLRHQSTEDNATRLLRRKPRQICLSRIFARLSCLTDMR